MISTCKLMKEYSLLDASCLVKGFDCSAVVVAAGIVAYSAL